MLKKDNHNLINISKNKLSSLVRYFPFLSFALVFLLFGNTLYNQYNFDDELVTNNHRLTSKGFSAIGDIFKSYYHEDNMGYKYEYRPITTASFAIEHGAFGESPFISHLINVLLFALSVLLIYFLTLNISSGNIFLSIITSVIFLSFPLHTEAVASIKNRDEILSLLFALLSTYFLLKFIHTKQHLWLALIAVFFMASLLSKMSAFSFLLILPLMSVAFFSININDYAKICLSVLLPAVYVLYLKEISTNQISNYSLVAIVLFVVTFYIIQLIKNDKALVNVKNLFSKISFPEQAIVYNKEDYSIRNIVLYTIILSIACYFFIFNNQHYFIVAFLLYLLTIQYYLKSFRTIELIVATILLLLTNYKQIFFEVNSLFMFYAFHKIYKSNFPKIKQALLSLIILVLLGTMYYLHGSLNPIVLPSLSAVSLFLLNKYKPNKKYYGAFWILVLFATIIYPLFTVEESISLSNLIVPLFSLLYLFVDEKKLSVILSVFIPVLLATYLYNVPNKINGNQTSLETSQFNTVVNTSIPKQANGNEDRPLDFVEFPLGFSPTLSQKVGTVAIVLGKYLKMMFVPYPMAFYYGFDEIKVVEATNPLAIISVIIHLALFIIAIYFSRSHPILSFGILAYLFSIALFSNLTAPVAGMFGDRLTYVASLGFSISIGYLFYLAYNKLQGNNRKILVGVFVLLMLTYSGLTIARNAQWENHLTLMRHDIKVVNNSAQAHNMLASNLIKYSFEKKYEKEADTMRQEAIIHFKKAIEIYPEFFNAWFDLGRSYMLFNDFDNAYPCFEKVHAMDSTLSQATMALAMIAEQKGNNSTAIYYYEKVITITPYIKEAYGNLSYLYFRLQQPYKSIEVNKKAIAYNPNWKEPYENIERVESFLKQNNIPLQP